MDRFGWNRTRIAPMARELAGVAAGITETILYVAAEGLSELLS